MEQSSISWLLDGQLAEVWNMSIWERTRLPTPQDVEHLDHADHSPNRHLAQSPTEQITSPAAHLQFLEHCPAMFVLKFSPPKIVPLVSDVQEHNDSSTHFPKWSIFLPSVQTQNSVVASPSPPLQ